MDHFKIIVLTNTQWGNFCIVFVGGGEMGINLFRLLRQASNSLENLQLMPKPLKFIDSEKTTKFCKISTLLLSYVVPVKCKVEISQNVVAFSECMNFNTCVDLCINRMIN